MRATTIALAGLICLVMAFSAMADENKIELGKLKAKFKARYPTLVKLKNAGKIGETQYHHLPDRGASQAV